MLLIMKKTFINFLFILLINVILSPEEINKKYFNNVFSGGRENILSSKTAVKNIEIYNIDINVDLYKSYSVVKATYFIKNNGDTTEILWAFPILDANIKKVTEFDENGDKEKKWKMYKINGKYNDFSIMIDGKKVKYQIKEGNIKEINIPFKTGDVNSYINGNKKKIEEIDSYFYTYSWYTVNIKINSKEKKVITVKYICPLYYNLIEAKRVRNLSINEDPALKYTSYKEGQNQYFISEKVFNYLLCTSYSKNNKIDNLNLIIKSHIIDQDYLKLLPVDYKKRGFRYIWKFSNIEPKSLHNILIKISPYYSDKTIDLMKFKSKPEMIFDGYDSYYKINKNRDEIVLEYLDGYINVKKIRLLPNYFDTKKQLEYFNLPVEILIEFSNSPDFKNSHRYQKKYSLKKIIKSLRKRQYYTIFNSKGVYCKYIKIKILKTSKSNDTVIIRDIQILK